MITKLIIEVEINSLEELDLEKLQVIIQDLRNAANIINYKIEVKDG